MLKYYSFTVDVSIVILLSSYQYHVFNSWLDWGTEILNQGSHIMLKGLAEILPQIHSNYLKCNSGLAKSPNPLPPKK